MKRSPSVGISRPAIMRSTVVLPPPLGPRRAINSPSLTEKLTLLTAVTSPNFLLTFFSSMLIQSVQSRSGLLGEGIIPFRLPFDKRFDGERCECQQHQHAREDEGGRHALGGVIDIRDAQRQRFRFDGDAGGS